MRILFVHNFYQIAGGEDAVLNNEILLLRNNGFDVRLLSFNNKVIDGFFVKFLVAAFSSFSLYGFFLMVREILRFKPDVVHVHNYFPLASPAVFWACKFMRVPVVHTLHNFRSLCPTALLLHNGVVDDRSLKVGPWWALKNKVYKESFFGTFFVCTMISLNKFIGTWTRCVDQFIALTNFQKNIFIRAGWAGEAISVKSNFLKDFYDDSLANEVRDYALFVGRISPEKGIDVLLDGWGKTIGMPLKVVGTGPCVDSVKDISRINSNIEYLGHKSSDEVKSLMLGARFVVMPSLCYEGFPMVLIEAFCSATPALVSRIGSLSEIVEEGVLGLCFNPGDASDFALKAQWLIDNPSRVREMSDNARVEYLKKYTEKENISALLKVYERAIERRGDERKS